MNEIYILKLEIGTSNQEAIALDVKWKLMYGWVTLKLWFLHDNHGCKNRLTFDYNYNLVS